MDLVDKLIELQKRFNNSRVSDSKSVNILSRYDYLKKSSSKGRKCKYAIKYLSLFIEHDWDDIRQLILETADQIRENEQRAANNNSSDPHQEDSYLTTEEDIRDWWL